jgi:hypothetical protein
VIEATRLVQVVAVTVPKQAEPPIVAGSNLYTTRMRVDGGCLVIEGSNSIGGRDILRVFAPGTWLEARTEMVPAP